MNKNIIIAIAALLSLGVEGWAQNRTDSDIDGLEYSNGWYEIPDAAALQALATYVNDGNNCEALNFRVTADITFGENDTFTPIGTGDETDGTPFQGTFDGQGHTISGINYSDPEGVGIGFFGYIHYPVVIKDVKLENCSFTGNYEVGAIAGWNGGSTDHEVTWGISGCTVGNNVTVTAVTATIEGDSYPGAFAGGIIGACNNMPVKDCVSGATVTGDELVGGITGRLLSSVANGQEVGVIENCYFSGTATATGSSPTHDAIGMRGPSDYDTEGTEGLIRITLLSDDSNEEINNVTRMDNYLQQTCDVTLSGRTLYKDGGWNTLCLPFTLDGLSGTPLEEATVKTLSTASFSNGKLTLNFVSSTKIEAGKPYLVKWTKASDYVDDNSHNVYQPTFSGVTLVSGTTDITTDKVDFLGNFSPVSLQANDKTILYMGGDNKLYYPTASFSINSFRGYFKLKGITASDINQSNAIILNFDGDTTGISSLSHAIPASDKAWFTLDGRRISGQPTVKGVYINNGKKISIH